MRLTRLCIRSHQTLDPTGCKEAAADKLLALKTASAHSTPSSSHSPDVQAGCICSLAMSLSILSKLALIWLASTSLLAPLTCKEQKQHQGRPQSISKHGTGKTATAQHPEGSMQCLRLDGHVVELHLLQDDMASSCNQSITSKAPKDHNRRDLRLSLTGKTATTTDKC